MTLIKVLLLIAIVMFAQGLSAGSAKADCDDVVQTCGELKPMWMD